jgi:Flp pilus assembly protein TadG
MGLVTKIRQNIATWLDRRRSPRRSIPVRAFYWDGSGSTPHEVRNISGVGAYIVTEMKWYRGTIMDVIFEPGTAAASNGVRPALSHIVTSKVTRIGEDGIGIEFLHKTHKDLRNFERIMRKMADQKPKVKAAGNSSEQGQSLLEFSLILPLLLLLVVNLINFGAFFYAWVTIANSARAGAQYSVMAGATVGAPDPPSAAQVATVITNDAINLPNSASLQVRVCTNNNGTQSCTGSGSAVAPPNDPEATSYVLVSVDVAYTYQPLIPGFNFSGLGIHATIPPTAMHRRAVMRRMQ